MLAIAVVLLALVFLAFVAVLWRGVRADGVRAAREAVAAAPESARGRLAALIEAQGALEAEMKGLRRQWADFETSWERRWGTLTRAARREREREAAEPLPSDSTDPAQQEFAIEGAPAPAAVAGERRHLRPARLHLGR